MKAILFFLFCGLVSCPLLTAPPTAAATSTATLTAPADSIDFSRQIQPVLIAHCMPCHFPGGKMYEKMPFDQPATVLAHAEGMLKRFKEFRERDLLERFIEQAGK